MGKFQKGYEFFTGGQVTATKINNLVDDAIALPGLITEQTTLTSTDSSDYALVSDTDASGQLKRVTLSNFIPDGGIATVKIADGAVTTAKLPDQAVTTAKLANNSVTTAKIIDANITTAKIIDSNVTTAKIADSNVTTSKLANGAVTSAKLATDAALFAKGAFDNGGVIATGSKNFASVTNPSTGVWDVTFTTPATDTSYVVLVTANEGGVSGVICGYENKLTTGFTIHTRNSGGSNNDSWDEINFIVL